MKNKVKLFNFIIVLNLGILMIINFLYLIAGDFTDTGYMILYTSTGLFEIGAFGILIALYILLNENRMVLKVIFTLFGTLTTLIALIAFMINSNFGVAVIYCLFLLFSRFIYLLFFIIYFIKRKQIHHLGAILGFLLVLIFDFINTISYLIYWIEVFDYLYPLLLIMSYFILMIYFIADYIIPTQEVHNDTELKPNFTNTKPFDIRSTFPSQQKQEPDTNTKDFMDTLNHYKQLFDEGVISEEEFIQIKQKLIEEERL